ncbi:hypothetical protein TRVL_06468 [Trypanosoma vivax]|nr:hypothetical protein TRVL_06468 [Trypanosoma vivax]
MNCSFKTAIVERIKHRLLLIAQLLLVMPCDSFAREKWVEKAGRATHTHTHTQTRRHSFGMLYKPQWTRGMSLTPEKEMTKMQQYNFNCSDVLSTESRNKFSTLPAFPHAYEDPKRFVFLRCEVGRTATINGLKKRPVSL